MRLCELPLNMKIQDDSLPNEYAGVRRTETEAIYSEEELRIFPSRLWKDKLAG
jgi:hypothetical protein